jgi:hypothetical protein
VTSQHQPPDVETWGTETWRAWLLGELDPPENPAPTAVVDLDQQRESLAESIRHGRFVPAGRLLGLPELPDGDVWVDTAGASAVARAAPKTMSGWLARQRPRGNPFPQPTRVLYRLYWPLSAVSSWRRRQDQLEAAT